MEDSSKTILTSILDYLLIALRYVASGFVALGAYVYLYDPQISQMKDIGGALVFSAATIGIVTYALHFSTLDKIFYGICVKKFIIVNKGFLPSILHTQIDEWEEAKGNTNFSIDKLLKKFEPQKSEDTTKTSGKKAKNKLPNIKRYVLFALANQTYLRSLSDNKMLAEMQKQVEKRLSLLNFLYCSSYQIIIVTTYFTITHIDPSTSIHWPYVWEIILLFCISGIFIYSAYRFNLRICSREMWLVQNFEQKVDEIKKAKKTD